MSIEVQPYVGVTGATSPGNVDHILKAFREHDLGPDQPHNGMIGFLATHRTVNNQPRHTVRQVESMKSLIALAARVAQRALSVVHFETEGESAIAVPILSLFQELYPQDLCRSAQINGTPDPDEIKKIMDTYPEMKLIYQIRPELLSQGVQRIADEIGRHRGAFKYALIDPSCGRGVNLKMDDAIALHQTLQSALPDVCFGSAGGYSGENAEHRVTQLAQGLGHKHFCVDAEGKLRFRDTDELSPLSMQKYISGVTTALQD